MEHSLDSETWESIGKVQSHGDSDTVQTYSLEHDKPASGINFYRLWQISFDGAKDVHGPVTIRVTSKKNLK